MVGVAASGLMLNPERGDFLVRGIGGVDSKTGAVAVTDVVRAGTKMRYLVRDKEGAATDLSAQCAALARRGLASRLGMSASLADAGPASGDSNTSDASDSMAALEKTLNKASAPPPGTPFGALLFSCAGRGAGLYGETGVDSRTFSQFVPVPVTGAFVNGEIGPVQGAAQMLGFTAVFAVLKAVPPAEQQSSSDAA